MTHTLIIGGGIAGAASAIALGKAGISATVYEAYPTGADDIGAFLMIMHNGFDALRAIDAQQPVVDASFGTTRVEYLTGDGATVTARPIGDKLTDVNGPRTLKRADLYRALHDEWLRRGGRIEHGKRLIDVVSTDGAVTAIFDDGSEATGDLLIGADGIHSATRTLIDPQAPAPRYIGKNLIYGYATDPALPTAPDTFRMVHGSTGAFGYTTSPTGETFWTTSAPGPEFNATLPQDWQQRAIDLFAGDADTSPADIIRATAPKDIMVSGSYDVPSIKLWHASSMVLVGDAAHAATPAAAQGASMALEDSVILARCLRDLSTFDEAFRVYERIRRERVERLVAFSANQSQKAGDGDDEDFKRRAQADSRDWLYRHHIDWDAPVHAAN